MNFERRNARRRTFMLLAPDLARAQNTLAPASDPLVSLNGKVSALGLLLRHASLETSPYVFIVACAAAGFAAVACTSSLLSPWCMPAVFALGFYMPLSWADARARARSLEFAQDYPTMLLATASSVQVGLTPYHALERSTRLLPKDSLVRTEVDALLRSLRTGAPRELAVEQFGSGIRQSDLPLFRSAFLLVLENGGRFAPTLNRLAAVSNSRAALIRSAEVSTASMRLTANVLIILLPILLLAVSARSPDFWEILLGHSTANLIGSAGLIIIVGCYAILRHMSNFKP